MTMKVTEHKLVTKRKKHPNHERYPCRSSHEILNAGMKLLSVLEPNEKDQFFQGKLIIDEEETAELFDSIEAGDIIGLGRLRSNGFTADMYDVVSIDKKNDFLVGKQLHSDEEEEIAFEDISVGIALGFAEILYRDDKPYGVSEDVEIVLKVYEEDKEETKSEKKSKSSRNKSKNK